MRTRLGELRRYKMIPENYLRTLFVMNNLIIEYGPEQKLVGERGLNGKFKGKDTSFVFGDICNYELPLSKKFLIEDNITQLLLKTKSKYHSNKLPFRSIFIDCNLRINKINILGLLLFEDMQIVDEKGLLSKHIFCFYEFEGSFLPIAFPYSILCDLVEDYEYLKEAGWDINMSKKVRNFVINFLDFLNTPEIELVTIERTKEQNTKRIKKGKIPIPIFSNVRVTGKLKIYINQLQSDGSFHCSHRFWVRGHFRTLRNKERYGNKIGTKIWVVPYIKGKGILIDKMYDVENKKEKVE